ncbi:MAG: hypothetical protein IT405_03235 [Candidatus Yanofskybacteria bacterium]|nr:hypothetical protein [Candidatus Yanofskybacteria bacterium]
MGMMKRILSRALRWLGHNWFRVGILLSILLVVVVASASYQGYQNRKSEEANKKYAADRRNDCLAIYKTEGAKWSNVKGWRYGEGNDTCYIRYSDPKPKSDAKCDELYPLNGGGLSFWWRENALCKDGEFENTF